MWKDGMTYLEMAETEGTTHGPIIASIKLAKTKINLTETRKG